VLVLSAAPKTYEITQTETVKQKTVPLAEEVSPMCDENII